MKVLHRHCAGLDVHKQDVVACARVLGGRKAVQEVRTFGTTTRSCWRWRLAPSKRHARGHGVDRGLLEAGLEPAGGPLQLMLVNAQHIKQVPGRKTDVKDAEWIAQLLQHGLLGPASCRRRRSGSCAT